MEGASEQGMKWRTEQMCAMCPFSGEGAGLHLWQSLNSERRAEILNILMADGTFYCHNTTEEDPDGEDENYIGPDGLLCSGAIEWQENNLGHPGQLARIGERLEATRKDFDAKPEVEMVSVCCGAPEHPDIVGFCSDCRDGTGFEPMEGE